MGLQLDRLGKKVLPPVIGRIAIGEKSERGLPTKLDYFIFTHPVDPKTKNAEVDKVATEAMEEKFGVRPKRIRVTLPFHHPDEVFYSTLTNYPGAKGWDCKSEDGCTAFRKDKNGEIYKVDCDYQTCKYKYDDKGRETCKATGILTVMLLDVPKTGGVWRFSTRGYYSVAALQQSLEFLYKIRGSLQGLEVELVYTMVPMQVPNPNGGTSKQNVPVIKAELPFSAKELALGSGTVYGDFQEIMLAAKAAGKLPNRQLMQELSMAQEEEPPLDGELVGEGEGDEGDEGRNQRQTRRSETRQRGEGDSGEGSGRSSETRGEERGSSRRSRGGGDDDHPF